MSNNELAFFIGLLGSVHCIGMCGPLAFAVPVQQPGWFPLLWNKLVYQLGRILSYMLLGVIAGLLGRQIWQAGLQQSISVLTGFLILLAAISRIANLNWPNNTRNSYLRPFYRLFDYAFKHKANHLIIGMLNGLLPCGFVYLALAGATNTGTITGSVSYMFWFGAGTVPLMLAATVIVGFSGIPFRKKLNKAVPFALLFLGAWFLLRGLELNIPYLSPKMPNSKVSECK
ncbi:MAG: sulfite exporter TauE/SafE family protein [Bacteroidota bacterium]